MNFILIRVTKPEDYIDIHDEILFDDFMDNPSAFEAELILSDEEEK